MYLLAMLKPISPIIGYYINYDYIVNVLCENKDKPVMKCNGKCHLAKELKKANDGIDPKENVPPLNMKEYPVAPILSEKNISEYYFATITKTYLQKKNESFIDSYYNVIFEPPKFSI